MRITILILIVIAFISCESTENEKKTTKNKNEDKVVVSKYGNGSVRAEIPMKDGKKNGIAKEYYEGGELYREIEYVNGKKAGISKRYFENGHVSQETVFKNDKIHGTQKKFRENGKPASVAEYYEDNPRKGVVEYFTDGKVKDNYPQIVITPDDRVYSEGLYIVRISLSEKVKEVEYYLGRLTKEKTIGPNSKKIWNTDKNGMAQIEYPVLPRTFLMEKIHIIAKITTPLGNYFITEKDYNVAAENR